MFKPFCAIEKNCASISGDVVAIATFVATKSHISSVLLIVICIRHTKKIELINTLNMKWSIYHVHTHTHHLIVKWFIIFLPLILFRTWFFNFFNYFSVVLIASYLHRCKNRDLIFLFCCLNEGKVECATIIVHMANKPRYANKKKMTFSHGNANYTSKSIHFANHLWILRIINHNGETIIM